VAAREGHSDSALRYVLVWGALLLLTGLTYGLSLIDMGAGSIVVALGIAVVKSSLVAIFFMHILAERGTVRLTPIVGVFFVVLLALLAIADFRFRFPPGVAGESPRFQPVWRQMAPTAPELPMTPTMTPTPLK
jgi:cytochrome c oxidase subunit 4